MVRSLFRRAEHAIPSPRAAGRGEIENRSRDASAPELLPTTKRIQFPQQRGGAERRQAHPANVRAAPADVAIGRCVRARMRAADKYYAACKCTRSAQLICFPGALASRRSAAALATPVATSIGSAPGRVSWDAALAGVTRLCLSQSSALRADRSLCRTNGVQGRPGAGLRIPPAGAALAPPSVRHR